MGNTCLKRCLDKQAPNLRNKIRCMYFCCLSGATINVKHNTQSTDECDGGEDMTCSLDYNKTVELSSWHTKEYIGILPDGFNLLNCSKQFASSI